MPEEYTYRLIFAYNGTAYAGWQRQPGDVVTVQEVLEKILRDALNRPNLCVTGCGRTDAGVHALGMTVSFRIDAKLNPELIFRTLEKRFPHDMRLVSFDSVPADFNAHTFARGKAYVYVVNTGYENLFLRDACWSWSELPCRMDAVREAVPLFAGTRDFKNFCGRKLEPARRVRTVFRSELVEFGPVFCFYFSGDGFLYKMVRRMMGFLHRISLGELSPEDLRRALADPEYFVCEEVAPPRGLYLKKVFYHPEEWRSDRLEHPPFYG